MPQPLNRRRFNLLCGWPAAAAHVATAAAVLVALVAAPNPGWAQTASSGIAAADESASNEGLQEVVVTAERVQSTEQKTPISLAVQSGADLTNANVLTLANLTQVEPSVIFNQDQFNGASATIRGVSSSSGAAVTINIDGQYVLTGFNPALFDIARVEVLKGPQGTLYGENSTGGNINIITNAPQLNQFSLEASGMYGDYNQRSYNAYLNVPIGESLAIRLSGFSTAQDGFRTHPGLDSTDFADTNALRASVLWKPNNAFTAHVTAEYSDSNFGGPAQQGVLVSPSPLTPAGAPPNNFTSAGISPYTWGLDYQGWNNARSTFLRGTLSYDFGVATLTYLGGYRYLTNPFSQSAFGTASQTTDFDAVHSRENTYQQELRLNGTTRFGLTWQIGGFYLDDTTDLLVNIYAGVTAFNPPRTVAFLTFTQPSNLEIDKAGYAQLTQKLTSQLSLTGGIRYTAVYQSNNPDYVSQLNLGSYFGTGGAVIGYDTINTGGNTSYDKTTYRVDLDYQLTPASLLYGSVSTGFRDGGFTSFNSFLPEEITAYEIGSKNRFAGGRVQVNGALFYYKYSDQQEQLFVIQPSGVAASTTVNAGGSILKGGEANLDWAITGDDRLSASAAYLDAYFQSFSAAEPIVPSGDVSAVNVSLAGNQPPQAPKWTLTFAYDHVWHFPGGATLTGSADIRHMSDYYLSVFNMAGTLVKAYEQSNAELLYRSSNQAYEISAFVRNIENHSILNFAQYLTQGPANVYMFGWAAPRTYGLRATVYIK